jgi:hypothetical protein
MTGRTVEDIKRDLRAAAIESEASWGRPSGRQAFERWVALLDELRAARREGGAS